jgi:hypothetical protein
MFKPLFRVVLPALLALSLAPFNGCGHGSTDLPECLQQLVDGDPDWPHTLISPSAYISRCAHKGQVVYYMPAQCCDIPSYVFDKDCNIICSPDGGITGQGDGRCPDFNDVATAGEIIWRRSETPD